LIWVKIGAFFGRPPLPAALDCRGGVIRWQRSRRFLIFPARRIDDICCWEQRSPSYHFGRRGDHACLSTCYVSCSHWLYDEPWLLDIASTSVAIIGLCSRTECPPRREDLAEPPHYRPVHGRRSRLQVRVVLQPRRLSVRTVLPAGSPSSIRPGALILAAIIGRFRRRKNAA
jgi:hypothetical protein